MGVRPHYRSSQPVALTRILFRARELHRGDKDIAALDRGRTRTSIFSCCGAEYSRVCMVRRCLESRIPFKELRGGTVGPLNYLIPCAFSYL